MSDDGFQRYLFEYNFAGATWGFDIMARSPGEAKERVKKLAWAKYQGEVKLKLSVPAGGFLPRWVRRIRAVLAKEAGQCNGRPRNRNSEFWLGVINGAVLATVWWGIMWWAVFP